jgi:hypothetical protein
MPSFIEVVQEEISECQKIIQIHTDAGENDIVAIDQMFPHKTADLAFMIFTKAARVVGYEMHGEMDKVRMEVQDIINYCGFLLAFLQKKKWS